MNLENKNITLVSHLFAGIILFGLALLSAIYIFPHLNWGKLELVPTQTITVTGEAKSQEKTQIAHFTAGVNAVNNNKDQAVSEVNKKMADIIKAVKDFGIDDKDIQTQNLSIYQGEETYYEEGVQRQRPGQWRVSNSVSITLREVKRASQLADLLTKSGANNVYGPTFSLDDTGIAQNALLEKAIEDAQKKAEIMAKASGRKLDKILSVSEGSQSVPVYRAMYEAGGGGGGAPVEPGTETVYQTVTVTFQLK